MVTRNYSLILLIITTILIVSGCSSKETVAVKFPGGRTVHCELAETAMDQATGLSRHKSLAADEGMIFVYAAERRNVSFWMPARMNFPIDFIFLDGNKTVVYIVENAQPCKSNLAEECPSYGPGNIPAQYVIEVVAGFCEETGLTLGDTLEFTLK